eukprot:TRINITY_DN32027_c0_g1_i1.p1 TRINITY_DN32027_c0_g1~~TRINITY_DN32027_c0_g1_i1.p1  ORF type:complete len:220 (-),score=33.76 TRINITY_DN32027_c0_g1_i1:26-685(-)
MDLQGAFMRIPPITRIFVTGAFILALSCFVGICTPFDLMFHVPSIKKKMEWWRIVTSFFFVGELGLSFVLNTHFMLTYFKRLEQQCFINNRSGFLYLILFGAVSFLLVSWWVRIQFLSFPLMFMIIYVWSRRTPPIQLAMFGVITFTAPYLPWAFLLLSYTLERSIMSNLIGIVVGHLYFYLADVFPALTGMHPLATPGWLKVLCGEVQRHHNDPVIAN